MSDVRHNVLVDRSAKLAAAADALKQQSNAQSAPFSLAFLTDQERAPSPVNVARALPQGSAVVMRDYELPDRPVLAEALKEACAASGVYFLIGGDPDLARKTGADGVHCPAFMLGDIDKSPGLLLTASCHSEPELKKASEADADLVFLGPAFPTKSHPDAPSLGAEAFKRLASIAKGPVLALGGVTEENAQRLAGKNTAGIAAIGAFLGVS